MNRNYSLSDGFSLTRSVVDCDRDGVPTLREDREAFCRIRNEYGTFAAPLPNHSTTSRSPLRPHFLGEANRVVYIPFSEFRKPLPAFERADLGGTTFATLTGIRPDYTGGLLAHNKVLLAGARLIENCSGQVLLAGTTALPSTCLQYEY
jgi:hypothetical protein